MQKAGASESACGETKNIKHCKCRDRLGTLEYIMEITAQNESEKGAQLYPITARSAELAFRCQQPIRKGSAVLRNGAGMLVAGGTANGSGGPPC